jgi:hypothetical protein
MKEITTEVFKIIIIILGIFFIVKYILNDKIGSVNEKLNKIESNTTKIDSISIEIDSLVGRKSLIINNINNRTTIINQQKKDLGEKLPKDTNINNAINYLREFAK